MANQKTSTKAKTTRKSTTKAANRTRKAPKVPVPPKPPVIEDKTKPIGIIAVILAVVMPFIGLILGIIGLVQSDKIKKISGKQAAGKRLSLVATILAPIMIIVYILIVVALVAGLVFFIFDEGQRAISGTWSCESAHSRHEETFIFKSNGDWRMETPDDPSNNYLLGEYDIVHLNVNGDNKDIDMKIRIDKVVADGEKYMGYDFDGAEWRASASVSGRRNNRMIIDLGLNNYVCERQ